MIEDPNQSHGLQAINAPSRGLPEQGAAEQVHIDARRRTAMIEIGGHPAGTGFLVGPDLLLTAAHVIDPSTFPPTPSGDVIAVFDFLSQPGRSRVETGVRVRVSVPGVAGSLPTQSEIRGDVNNFDATDANLDFLLMRLARNMSNDCTNGPRRGFYELHKEEYTFRQEERLIIPTHPLGQTLKASFATGPFLVNIQKNRVRYVANTFKGSSGSAVLNADGRLVALHHSAAPGSNQGVLTSKIAACIETKIKLPRLAQQPSPPEAPEPRDEYRQLTIMTCEIVDYVKLSVVPENESAILNRLRPLLSEAAQECGGSVYERLDGQVVVCFGFPRPLEDGPEHAIRCALKILRSRTPDVHLRFGVHQGETLIENVGYQQQRRLGGPVPRIAAEICAGAQPDTILVSDQIKAAASNAFEFSAGSPLSVKTGDDPILCFQVLVERDTESIVSSNFALPQMVGRKTDLQKLTECWLEASGSNSRGGRKVVVSIEGEPGIGKSRLVDELVTSLRDTPASIILLKCSEIRKGQEYWSIRNAIRRIAKIADGDPVARAKEKFESMLESAFTDTEERTAATYLAGLHADLSSLPGEQYRKKLLIRVGQRIILAVAADRPILLWVDDAQWLDPSSKAILDETLTREGLRILVVLTIRPGYQPPLKHSFHSINLTRLTAEQSEQIVCEVAGPIAIPIPLTKEIIEMADGNPLFIRHLVGAAAKRVVAGETTLEKLKNEIGEVPDPLALYISARLSNQDAREVAKAASVAAVGLVFDRDALANILSLDEEVLENSLRELTEAEVIRPSELPEEDGRYEFMHARIQRCLYDTLRPDDLRDLHARTANYLLSVYEDTLPHSNELAHHLRKGEEVGRSLKFRLAAAQTADATAAYKEAIQYFDQGLKDVETLPDNTSDERLEKMRLELQFQRGLLGPLAAAEGFSALRFRNCALRGLELAVGLGATELVAPLYYSQFLSAICRGNVPLAREKAEQYLFYAKSANDPTALVVAHRAIGIVLLCEGRPGDGANELHESLRLCGKDPSSRPLSFFSPDARVTALASLAMANWLLGYPEEADKLGSDAIRRAQAIKHPLSEAFALSYFGGIAMGYARRESELERHARSLTRLSQEYDLGAFGYYALGFRGVAHLLGNRPRAAIEALVEATNGLRKIEWLLSVGDFETWLAEAYLAEGQWEEALAICDRVGERASTVAERWFLPEFYRVRGKALLLRGSSSRDEAIVQFRTGASIAREMASPPLELRCLEDLVRLFGDIPDRASVELRIAELKLWIQSGGARGV